jgi:hypothetical protein
MACKSFRLGCGGGEGEGEGEGEGGGEGPGRESTDIPTLYPRHQETPYPNPAAPSAVLFNRCEWTALKRLVRADVPGNRSLVLHDLDLHYLLRDRDPKSVSGRLVMPQRAH